MGAIQQSIDQTLRIGSALFTQTPVYKRQAEVNLAREKIRVAEKKDKQFETVGSAEKLLSARRELYDIKPTPENLDELDYAERIYTDREQAWKWSREQVEQERETKIRQKEFYKKFMGVLNE